MRRFICIVSAFTLLLAGCVKNEPLTSGGQEPKAEIAFESPIVAPKAKSVQEIASGFPTTIDMKVWGFYSETQYPAVDAINHTVGSHNYMLGALYQNEGAVWGCSEKGYYWPHSGYLHFVAFAPAAPAGGLTASDVTDEGLQLTGYTVPSAADEDLLVSQVAYSQTKPADPEDGAPLVFDHALSSIVFKVNSGIYGDMTTVDPDRVDTDLRITKIELWGLKNKGDFDQAMTTWTNNEQMTPPNAAQNPEKGWSGQSGSVTYTGYDCSVAGNEGLVLTGTPQFIHDKTLAVGQTEYALTNLILLPQVLSSNENAVLRVTYDMTHSNYADINDETELWVPDQVAEIKLKDCGISEWLRGYRYTYNITLSLGKILCDADVVGWDVEAEKEIDYNHL